MFRLTHVWFDLFYLSTSSLLSIQARVIPTHKLVPNVPKWPMQPPILARPLMILLYLHAKLNISKIISMVQTFALHALLAILAITIQELNVMVRFLFNFLLSFKIINQLVWQMFWLTILYFNVFLADRFSFTQVRVRPTEKIVPLVVKANIPQTPVQLVKIANRANFKNCPQQQSTSAKFVKRASFKTSQEVLSVNSAHLVKI